MKPARKRGASSAHAAPSLVAVPVKPDDPDTAKRIKRFKERQLRLRRDDWRKRIVTKAKGA
jgi:hypothetical protein